MSRSFWLIFVVAAVGALVLIQGPSPQPRTAGLITEPAILSAEALLGKQVYVASCAGCHGSKGGGTKQGPPLIHRIYDPSHHADAAFQAAVRVGVRQHHWRFGNMPPQPLVTVDEVRLVVRYIRELQWANGIGDNSAVAN